MTRTGRTILVAFVAWTAFVWFSRISNTLRSTTESAGGKAFSTVLSIVMLAIGVAVAVVLVRGWSAVMTPASVTTLRVAAIATAVVWLVRVPQIVFLDDDPTHGAPFKIVHAVLGLLSVGLAAGLWKVAGEGASRPAIDTAPVGR
jgi:hypothetical protein